VTKSTSDPIFVLALLWAAQYMVILHVTVVSVALPSIQADLGFAFSDLKTGPPTISSRVRLMTGIVSTSFFTGLA
jgi:MFS family permease